MGLGLIPRPRYEVRLIWYSRSWPTPTDEDCPNGMHFAFFHHGRTSSVTIKRRRRRDEKTVTVLARVIKFNLHVREPGKGVNIQMHWQNVFLFRYSWKRKGFPGWWKTAHIIVCSESNINRHIYFKFTFEPISGRKGGLKMPKMATELRFDGL